MQVEKACGAVIYTWEDQVPIYLLIQNLRGGHWGFPKGHVEAGESERQTAEREIQEETGLRVQIDSSFRKSITYPLPHGMKESVYFVAEIPKQTIHPQEEEVSNFTYLPYSEALKQITHDSDRSVLEAAHAYITA